MADKNNNKESEFNFEMFLDGDNGAQILSNDDLKELNKKLPKWNIKPPAKYSANRKKDA